ncbi:unnamed protein product [Bursaphelenchus okinawaensis]|uniref:Nucleoside phosphorylase domain-containing protein n=1 Tax=Bursaphelenchus okinawaensis TaxID=465554 RepID=A0A811KIJ5_9BILA|nr:unnamed protein product [Bursaphelenchus okinawaensis]CAG9103618.1 unnamed protein product [Bursaphelenchus okinawaensis]
MANSGHDSEIKTLSFNDRVVKYVKTKEADVVEDQYEGGHQLWQGTRLQLSYYSGLSDFKTNNVLDIGCGNGLLGIFLVLYSGAKNVVFQDLNEDVLSETTKPNLELNEICSTKYSLVSGFWPDCFKDLPINSFDLIVTSDTVYRVKNFGHLHGIFEKYLQKSKDAKVFVSGKDLYFGNDGGILPFRDYVTKSNVFDVTVVMTDEEDILFTCFTMEKVRIDNPHLLLMKDDTLYHFGLKKSTTDFVKEFGDVKFVCCGGSSGRIKMYAELFSKKFSLLCSGNLSRSDRFCLYKTGGVLWVNHGMGVPSLSIMLNEAFKLLYYAGATDVTFVRIGTSGGIGVPPGTVIVSNNAMDSLLRNEYVLETAGKTLRFDCSLDEELSQDFFRMAKEMNYAADMGTTMCANDFYEGQMRLDGAFCEVSLEEKVEYLKKLSAAGVKNIEMESTCFAAMTKRANCKAAIICVTLVNRMLGDQVTVEENDYKEFEMRPFNVVTKFISKRLQYNGY